MGRGRHDLRIDAGNPEAMDALRKVIVNSRQIYGCVGHALVAAPDVAGRGIVELAF